MVESDRRFSQAQTQAHGDTGDDISSEEELNPATISLFPTLRHYSALTADQLEIEIQENARHDDDVRGEDDSTRSCFTLSASRVKYSTSRDTTAGAQSGDQSSVDLLNHVNSNTTRLFRRSQNETQKILRCVLLMFSGNLQKYQYRDELFPSDSSQDLEGLLKIILKLPEGRPNTDVRELLQKIVQIPDIYLGRSGPDARLDHLFPRDYEHILKTLDTYLNKKVLEMKQGPTVRLQSNLFCDSESSILTPHAMMMILESHTTDLYSIITYIEFRKNDIYSEWQVVRALFLCALGHYERSRELERSWEEAKGSQTEGSLELSLGASLNEALRCKEDDKIRAKNFKEWDPTLLDAARAFYHDCEQKYREMSREEVISFTLLLRVLVLKKVDPNRIEVEVNALDDSFPYKWMLQLSQNVRNLPSVPTYISLNTFSLQKVLHHFSGSAKSIVKECKEEKQVKLLKDTCQSIVSRKLKEDLDVALSCFFLVEDSEKEKFKFCLEVANARPSDSTLLLEKLGMLLENRPRSIIPKAWSFDSVPLEILNELPSEALEYIETLEFRGKLTADEMTYEDLYKFVKSKTERLEKLIFSNWQGDLAMKFLRDTIEKFHVERDDDDLEKLEIVINDSDLEKDTVERNLQTDCKVKVSLYRSEGNQRVLQWKIPRS